MSYPLGWIALAAAAFAGEAAPPAPDAGTLIAVSVADQNGEPVEDAVVFLARAEGKFEPPAEPYVMAQKGAAFVPEMLTVLAGAKVSFPNRDDFHHHIFSFSKAKTFDLPLSKGKSPPPLVFDKVGVVQIGCNIHDHMRAVILVVPNPHFARTGKDGTAALKVPAGKSHELLAFHERMSGSPSETAKTVEPAGGKGEARFALKLKKKRKAAGTGSSAYP